MGSKAALGCCWFCLGHAAGNDAGADADLGVGAAAFDEVAVRGEAQDDRLAAGIGSANERPDEWDE